MGSGPGGNRRGRSPVEYRGNLYVRTSVRTYVRPSTRPSPLRPIRGRPRPLRARCRPLLIGLDQRLRGLHLPLRGLGLPLIGLRGEGRVDGRTYRRTDVQIPPVFYRTSSPPVPSGAAAQKAKLMRLIGQWVSFLSPRSVGLRDRSLIRAIGIAVGTCSDSTLR